MTYVHPTVAEKLKAVIMINVIIVDRSEICNLRVNENVMIQFFKIDVFVRFY